MISAREVSKEESIKIYVGTEEGKIVWGSQERFSEKVTSEVSVKE